MNRSIANWLATNPGGAVFATGLLGLLPFFGIGFFFFLPGAVPALLALARGPRQGAMVAAGASLLLALAIWFIGRSVPVGVIYAFWVLGPPLALAWVLRRTGSLSLCLQLATLAGIGLLAVLHAALGDPTQFWSPVVRQLAQEMQRRGLSLDDVFLDTLARGLWGWVTVLTLLLGMCAVFLARWWQHLSAESGSFGTEFRFRNPETGKLDGGFVPVDFAMSAAAYGCKTYKVNTVEQLQDALADARLQTVSTLIDIKVLPKTMIHKYLSWWRVGVAQVSTSARTDAVAKTLNERLAKARQY